ncbi:MAG: hypothetical protein VX871_09390 [Pseudomonadota bacterium]|nr:hypothetical protein [Pseudomonadota bacterium]
MKARAINNWLVTLAVTLALLVSPCLSFGAITGVTPAHAATLAMGPQTAGHQHDGAGYGHGAHADTHSHDNGGTPADPQSCCKICDAWLSGRQDGDDPVVLSNVLAAKAGAFGPNLFAADAADAWMSHRMLTSRAAAPPTSPRPAVAIYRSTGRIRI